MRYETLTLAVAALLVIGAGGVVAAPMPVTDTSPAPDAQPSNHTVDVVDPADELTEREIAELRRLAWAETEVREQFEDTDTVHFHVESVGDDLEVYVATNESAPPRVVAEVALDEGAVTDVALLDDTRTAGSSLSVQLSPVNESALDDGTVTVRTASGPTVLTAENSTGVEGFAVTTVDAGNGSATFEVENGS